MVTRSLRGFVLAASLALMSVFSVGAKAVTIDFDGFALGNFAGGVEDGFTLGAVNGRVWPGVFGFPTNSFGSQDANQSVTLDLTSGGLFSFDSLDLVNPDFSGTLGPVTVTGYLAAAVVGTDLFNVPAVTALPESRFAVNLSGVTLDRLEISFMSIAAKTQLVDNINLSVVPLPAASALLALGLAGLAVVRRRPCH